MKKENHPLTALIPDGIKVLVRMPDGRLRWRKPRSRLGEWMIRDGYGWRIIRKVVGGYEADIY